MTSLSPKCYSANFPLDFCTTADFEMKYFLTKALLAFWVIPNWFSMFCSQNGYLNSKLMLRWDSHFNELTEALKNMKGGKTPGSNGFSVEFNPPPPSGFSRIAKIRRRAAPPGFHPPYPPYFPQLLWKFRTKAMWGQVTRSGQVTQLQNTGCAVKIYP